MDFNTNFVRGSTQERAEAVKSYRYKHPCESEWSQGPNLRWDGIGRNTLRAKERSSEQLSLLWNQIFIPASGHLIHTHLFYNCINFS